MRRAYQSDDEIGMIPREMAQGLRDLVGRAMVDPDFLVALQRSPNALLADYELTADERATILQALARLAKTADLLRFLRDVRLFTRFAEPELIALAESLHERRLRKNQLLFREGDPGDEMFIVRQGAVLVSKAIRGRVEQVLDHVRPADFFGEMSLLDGSPRSATVQAEADATLLALDRVGLQRLTDTNPRAAAAFFHALVHVFIERLRRSTHQVAEATRWGLEATGLDVESR